MNLLKKIFQPNMNRNSASLARERLQIIVSHERSKRSQSAEFLPELQKELVDVIAKYVKIDAEHVKVALKQRDEFSSVLELNITLPENAKTTEVA